MVSDVLNQLEFVDLTVSRNFSSVSKVDVVAGDIDSVKILGWTNWASCISVAIVVNATLYVTTTGGVLQHVGQNWTTGGT